MNECREEAKHCDLFPRVYVDVKVGWLTGACIGCVQLF